MRADRDLDDFFDSEVEDVSCPEAVTGCTERGYTFLLEAFDELVERWAKFFRSVRFKPFVDILGFRFRQCVSP